jgi:hypothetical protein
MGGCAWRISAPSQLRALAFKRKPEARRGTRRMVKLSDSQLAAVFDASRPLAVRDRDAFLRDLAAALAGIVDPGDGDVARAIRAVQRRHFDPPQFDERAQPHRRMARVRWNPLPRAARRRSGTFSGQYDETAELID